MRFGSSRASDLSLRPQPQRLVKHVNRTRALEEKKEIGGADA
jgi:hypothetical protein